MKEKDYNSQPLQMATSEKVAAVTACPSKDETDITMVTYNKTTLENEE